MANDFINASHDFQGRKECQPFIVRPIDLSTRLFGIGFIEQVVEARDNSTVITRMKDAFSIFTAIISTVVLPMPEPYASTIIFPDLNFSHDHSHSWLQYS